MWARLAKHWFLSLIAVAFAVGYGFDETLRPIAQLSWFRSSVVFAVMWAMGVTLKADAIRASIASPTPGLLAIGINILVVPLLALPAMWFLPERLFGGLFVAALVPCTLASASVWTRRAGGDDSVAMMSTVVTNLACVAVVPIGLALVLVDASDTGKGQISIADQVAKLSLLVVAPLVLAQAMRRFGFAAWSDRNKPKLSIAAQLGIVAMVVFGGVQSAQSMAGQDGGQSLSWTTMGVLLAATSSVHLAAMFIGILAAITLGVSRDRQIAVGIGGSQKTLMVGLQIAIDCGVSVVPMLVYHLGQLVIDTVIADAWKKNERTD